MSNLSKQNLVNWKAIAESDPEAFDFLLKELRLRDYKIDRTRGRLNKIVPGFDMFAWQVEETNLKASVGTKLEGIDVMHQGIHVVTATRFGAQLRDRPLMTLLNESIGVGLDLYLTAKQVGRKGFDPKSRPGKRVLEFFDIGAELELSVTRKINKALNDPFGAFKKVVEHTYLVHLAVYSNLSKLLDGTGGENLWEEVVASIKAHPYYLFGHDYTLALPAIILCAFCGRQSNAKDRALAEECLETLRSSSSMIEFLRKLKTERRNQSPSRVFAIGYQKRIHRNGHLKNFCGENNPIKKEMISDREGWRPLDRAAYDFLIQSGIAQEIPVNKQKSWLLTYRGRTTTVGQQLSRLGWFLSLPTFHHDSPGGKVSARQVLYLMAGQTVCEGLNVKRQGFPMSMLLASEVSIQVVNYFESLKKNSNLKKEGAFLIFKRNLVDGLSRRGLLLKLCAVKNQGRRINGPQALREILRKHPLSRWKKMEAATSILSAGAFCGFKSTASDYRRYEACLASIQDCGSLHECLTLLVGSPEAGKATGKAPDKAPDKAKGKNKAA